MKYIIRVLEDCIIEIDSQDFTLSCGEFLLVEDVCKNTLINYIPKNTDRENAVFAINHFLPGEMITKFVYDEKYAVISIIPKNKFNNKKIIKNINFKNKNIKIIYENNYFSNLIIYLEDKIIYKTLLNYENSSIFAMERDFCGHLVLWVEICAKNEKFLILLNEEFEVIFASDVLEINIQESNLKILSKLRVGVGIGVVYEFDFKENKKNKYFVYLSKQDVNTKSFLEYGFISFCITGRFQEARSLIDANLSKIISDDNLNHFFDTECEYQKLKIDNKNLVLAIKNNEVISVYDFAVNDKIIDISFN